MGPNSLMVVYVDPSGNCRMQALQGCCWTFRRHVLVYLEVVELVTVLAFRDFNVLSAK